MNNLLYSMIHDRAMLTYAGPSIIAKNYGIWVKHWFNTAEMIRSEFINERLFKTAKAIKDIIDVQRIICDKYLGE